MEKLQERINYLRGELAARGHYDGWVMQGMSKELARLEIKLKKLVKNFPV